MKNLLIILATTMAFVSCNSNAETARAIEQAKKATLDSINMVNTVKQRTIDSMKNVKVKQQQQQDVAVAPAPGEDAPVAKKKKWSHTAKGAVVGAGAGAITGAIANKDDRLKGAVIGTVIGAGTGAGIGAIVDNKEKKKKKKTAQ